MDELKSSHRKVDGPFRTTHEMERHQTQQQDAQVEEQIQVQTQFREHSSKLQAIFDKKQRVEVDITRKVSEERQLVGKPLILHFLDFVPRPAEEDHLYLQSLSRQQNVLSICTST